MLPFPFLFPFSLFSRLPPFFLPERLVLSFLYSFFLCLRFCFPFLSYLTFPRPLFPFLPFFFLFIRCCSSCHFPVVVVYISFIFFILHLRLFSFSDPLLHVSGIDILPEAPEALRHFIPHQDFFHVLFPTLETILFSPDLIPCLRLSVTWVLLF